MTARNQACTLGAELTPKDLEVLGLLATRLSRREIGQCPYVSLNSVKSHQRALYRKLGVEDPNTAVKPGTGARPALTHPAKPARSGPIPPRRGGEQSRRNHPGEHAVRVMTIHPARRKPDRDQLLASDDRTGTTKARSPHIVATGSRTKR